MKRAKESAVQEDAAWEERRRGQWMGFALSLLAVAGAVGLALADRELAGGLLGAGGVVGMLKVFVPPAPKVD